MATTNDENTNSSPTKPVVKQPPKKKRKRGNFWLVKVPNWVYEEWFDDNKYPNGSRLGELYVSPNTSDPNKKSMKLELNPPPLKRSKASNHHNYNYDDMSTFNKQVDKFKDIPVPSLFKMQQRESRNRVNVKHGSLKVLGKDQLLVFHDKPPFPIGSRVEALDNSRNRHRDMSDDEDDDMSNNNNKNNKKKNEMTSSIKGYAKGVVKEINDNRTFTVEFNKTKKQRYNVPERDIRFEDMQHAQRANKCKIFGIINGEMDVTPQWTPQYKQFLQLRSMKKSFQQSIKIKKKKDRFAQSQAERDAASMAIINENKRLDAKNARGNRKDAKGKKVKRVKNVRKDEKIYETLIFAAFEKESSLNQEDIARMTREPWNFLRPIVEKLCDRHKNASKGGRSWVLKPEYRLNTDADIQMTNVDDEEENK